MATTNNCLSPKDKTWMGFKTIALLHNHSRNCPPVIWPVLWSNDGGRKCRLGRRLDMVHHKSSWSL
jgi:hypothetical protein